MGYLWIVNWDRYQHYKDDKKPRKLHWVKFYVDTLDDRNLRELPIPTRLLWDQLLLLVARYGNPIEHDAKHIANAARIDLRSVREGIRQLITKGMLKETRTRRKPAKPKAEPSSKNLAESENPSTPTRVSAPSQEAEAEKALKPLVSKAGVASYAGVEVLPVETSEKVTRLMAYIGGHQDDRTFEVVQGLADSLPEVSLVKVLESIAANGSRVRDRAAYVVGALRNEKKERQETADDIPF